MQYGKGVEILSGGRGEESGQNAGFGAAKLCVSQILTELSQKIRRTSIESARLACIIGMLGTHCPQRGRNCCAGRCCRETVGEDGKIQYITQGDANNAEDSLPVEPDQIQGVWNGARVGGLGSFILFMQTPIGMVIFIICPLLLFIIWDIWRRRRLDKAEASRTSQLEAEIAALKNSRTEEQEDSSSAC